MVLKDTSIMNVPPYTNRGAQNTSETGLTSCVDWFSCTFHEEDSVRDIIRILGFQGNEFEFKNMPRGNYGYNNIVNFNGIKIMYNGREGMGIHVEMSGAACRVFEKYSNLEWVDLFRRVTKHERVYANITRLDLAIDDTKGYFRIPTLIKYLKAGHVTSLFKSVKRISNIMIKTGEEKGYTLYFGRPDSRIQVRFYEKNIEQVMKGKEIPEDCTIWNRTEIQARDERAHAFATLLATTNLNLGQIVAGTLRNYISFRRAGYVKGKQSLDSNKSRWDLAPFWIKFLGDAEKVKLTTKPIPASIERKYTWVDKSVKKTLAMLAFAFPEDSDYMLKNFIQEGYEKIEDEDWDLIKEFRGNNKSLDELIKEIKKATH